MNKRREGREERKREEETKEKKKERKPERRNNIETINYGVSGLWGIHGLKFRTSCLTS